MASIPKILLADDEADLCEILVKSLNKEGYEVLTASNGEEALSQLATEDIKLLILDLRMPGQSGLEVLRKLREQDNQIPVIIMTAYANKAATDAAQELRVIDFLSKPFDISRMKSAVKGALTA